MQRHLGLVTIKGMIGSPYDRAIHKHDKDLASPILMSCSSTLKLVALVACGRTGSGLWVMGCERSVLRPYPCFPCCPMLHGSSLGGDVLHGIA